MAAKQQKIAVNTKKSDILKYLLVIGAIAIIAWLFPSTVNSTYKFKSGDLWRYDDLYAPFDFAVKKSDEDLKREKSEITSDIYPFFLKQSEVQDEVISLWRSQVLDKRESLQRIDSLHPFVLHSDSYIDIGTDILSVLFQTGIIGDYPGDYTGELINVVESGTPEVRRYKQYLSVDQAQLIVMDSVRLRDLDEASLMASMIQANLKPNIVYDEDLTEKFTQEAVDRINVNKHMVLAGDVIIKRGDVITKDDVDELNSYEDEYFEKVGDSSKRWMSFAGYLLLTSMIIGVFLLYLQFHATELFNKYSSLLFMLMWPVLMSFMVTVVESTENLSAYMIPFCIVPIIVKNFYSERLALFTHIVIILIVSFLSKEGYEFTFLQILAGIVAVMTVKETRYWNQFFSSIAFIFLTYVMGYIGMELINASSIKTMNWQPIIYFIIAAILTLLAYPLIPLLEGIFGFTSSIKLAELSDLNQPLLRELSLKAPGTFQHSLQVANLGEAAAEAVGANGLLVKTAALFHDIGKTVEPQYFIENQREHNPHNELDELASARKIIEHVSLGAQMARKAKIPGIVIDFILSHHGTTRVEYFYHNYLKNHPDEPVDEAEFTYPGPTPQSREEAILMMADSIEAASKSLKNPTGHEIDLLVDKIISSKIERMQFRESELSFKDLHTCRKVFKSMLRNIYHVRIEYPEEAYPPTLDLSNTQNT